MCPHTTIYIYVLILGTTICALILPRPAQLPRTVTRTPHTNVCVCPHTSIYIHIYIYSYLTLLYAPSYSLAQRNYHEQSQLYQAFNRFQDESGAQFTCFTSTKVQILTPRSRVHNHKVPPPDARHAGRVLHSY